MTIIMSKNTKLTEYTTESSQQSTEVPTIDQDTNSENVEDNNTSEKGTADPEICECYGEMHEKYQETLDELGITPPKCGHCIEYLCESCINNLLAEGSVKNYNSSLRFLVDYLHDEGMCVEDAGFAEIRRYFEYRAGMERSKSCLQGDKNAVVGAIGRLEEEDDEFLKLTWKIRQNIDPNRYAVDSGFDREWLETEEIEKLLTELDDFRDQLMLLCSVELGPREEALCLIKTSDINLKEETIELRNTKIGGTYVMPLTENLVSLLEHWISDVRSSYVQNGDHEYLFPSRDGGGLSGSTYRSTVRKAAEDAGIQEEIAKIPMPERQQKAMGIDKDYRSKQRVDVHCLRHTFSRLLKKNDVSKSARSYALDHARDETDGYGKLSEAHIREIRNKFNGVDISNI